MRSILRRALALLTLRFALLQLGLDLPKCRLGGILDGLVTGAEIRLGGGDLVL